MDKIFKEKNGKIQVPKKRTFSLSKRLLKTLTTNQLIQLLPSIVDKIMHNSNVCLSEEQSDKTDLSIFTSNECSKNCGKDIAKSVKKIPISTHSHPNEFEKVPIVSPMTTENNKVSEFCKTKESENSSFRNDTLKTYESIFNSIFLTNHSNDTTLKKFKRYTKRLSNKYCKEYSDSTGKFLSVSDINMNCQKESLTAGKSESSGFLIISETGYDKSITPVFQTPYKLKSTFEVNQMSTLEYDEYFEFVDNDECRFVDICLNKTNKIISPVLIKPVQTYMTKSIKYYDSSSNKHLTLVHISPSSSESSLDNCFVKIKKSVDLKIMQTQSSRQYYSANSSEVRVDTCDDQCLDVEETTQTKSIDTIDTVINNFMDNDDDLVDNKELSCLIDEISLTKSGIDSSLSLSLAKKELDINQMGDMKTNKTVNTKKYRSETLTLKSSIQRHEATDILKKCGILFSSRLEKAETNKCILSIPKNLNSNFQLESESIMFDSKKVFVSKALRSEIPRETITSMLRNPPLFQTSQIIRIKRPIQSSLSSQSNRQDPLLFPNMKLKSKKKVRISSFKIDDPSIDDFQHSKYNKRNSINILGVSTSRVVNGRFRHGWQCTYKACLSFNCLQCQVCKMCLNPRWCHPPLCKRDVICGDCGYINYKSRLYCKKCKFIFVKNN